MGRAAVSFPGERQDARPGQTSLTAAYQGRRREEGSVLKWMLRALIQTLQEAAGWRYRRLLLREGQ